MLLKQRIKNRLLLFRKKTIHKAQPCGSSGRTCTDRCHVA